MILGIRPKSHAFYVAHSCYSFNVWQFGSAELPKRPALPVSGLRQKKIQALLSRRLFCGILVPIRENFNGGKNGKRKKILGRPVCGIRQALLICTIRSFTVVEFYGKTAVLFAPERLASPDYFDGRVLGDHVFETEYGEITLKHSAMIESGNNTINDIEAEVFASGKASHSLVIDGIEIPPNVYIGFWHYGPNHITILDDFGDQEITVSGIPLNLSKLDLSDFMGNGADIAVGGLSFKQESITLADSTELDVSGFYGLLFMYKDDGVWRLQVPSYSTFLAKLPGETEFTRYKSITFGENWGGFIEGELFEEEDPEV